MVEEVDMIRRLLPLVTLLIAAACTVPVQPVMVEAPEVEATLAADALEALQPATATLAPTVPAPATLETSFIASFWDETTGTASLVPLDPRTGEALEGYAPLGLGEGYSAARSPDGHWLATLNYSDRACDAWAGGSRCQPSDGVLHFVDLANWRDTTTSVPAGSNASFMLFSPDGQALAIGQSQWPEHGVVLVDAASGALLGRAALDFYPRQAAFSADGQCLFLYGLAYANSNGFDPEPRVAALDTTTLSVVWQQALTGILDGQYVPPEAKSIHDESVWWLPAVAFAPDASRLYVVHADEDKLTTVDFAAQSVTRVEIGPARSWLDRLMALTAGVAEAKMMNGVEKHAVLTPDGGRLYVVGARMDTGEGQFTRTPLGLQVIDAATGIELERRDTPASLITLAPDGLHLFLTAWDQQARTEVVAVNGLAPVVEIAGREVYTTRLVNGQPALFALRVGARSTAVRWLDPLTFGELASWKVPSSFWLVP
jgi:hypothetical protein